MATDGHPQPSSPSATSDTPAASPIAAWLGTLSTSVIAAVWVLSSLFAYVAAIFGEHAPDYIPVALGFSCVAAVIVSIVVTFTTRSGLLAYPQDSPVSIAALVSGAAAAAIAVGDFADPQRSVFLTTLLFLAFSSLLTGVAFWLLGRYNLGNVIRFIPYPVIGGFLAAIGWLLLKISLTTMTGEQFALAQLQKLFPVWYLWIPGIIMSVALSVASRRFSSQFTKPAILFGGIAVFYLVLQASGTSINAAREMRWLLPAFPAGMLLKPFTMGDFGQIDWAFLLRQGEAYTGVVVISTIDLLLAVKAISDSGLVNIKINRELQAAGYANMASFVATPIAVAQPSYYYVGLTKLTASARGFRGAFVWIIAALFILIVIVGGGVLSLVPRLALGGLVGFIGIEFLYEWFYLGWKEQSRLDATIITSILVIAELFGLIHAVTVGLLVTGALFIYNYSNIDVVRQEHEGASLHSNVDRPVAHRRILRDKGHKIYVVRLHGYIFFGSATRLEELIEERITHQATDRRPDFVIVDFHGVTGIDSSALHSFVRIKNIADEAGAQLVYCGMIASLVHVFSSRVYLEGTPSPHKTVADLDTALKACEDQLLETNGVEPDFSNCSLEELNQFFADPIFKTVLLNFFTEKHLPKGKVLVREGSPVDEFYIVRAGVLEVQSYLKGIHFGEYGPGSLVGVAAILAENEDVHEASVVAKMPSDVLVMSKQQLISLAHSNPTECLRFYQFLSGVLADRCIYSTRLMEDLLVSQ